MYVLFAKLIRLGFIYNNCYTFKEMVFKVNTVTPTQKNKQGVVHNDIEEHRFKTQTGYNYLFHCNFIKVRIIEIFYLFERRRSENK